MNSTVKAIATLAAAGAVMLGGTAAAQDQAAANATGAAGPAQEIPRTLDGRPDFTGVWTTYRGGAAAGGPPPAGARNRDGGGAAALTPLAQEKVAAYRAVTQGTNHSPGAYCVGSGMPASMIGSGGYPMEIVQHPRQINITYEAHKEIRRVYIGDHGFDLDEIFPERNGFSVGRWEGDTLVVETTGIKEYVRYRNVPHSANMRIIERISLLPDRNYMQNEIAVIDPEYLTEPWTWTWMYKRWPSYKMQEYICEENLWGAGEDGAATLRIELDE